MVKVGIKPWTLKGTRANLEFLNHFTMPALIAFAPLSASVKRALDIYNLRKDSVTFHSKRNIYGMPAVCRPRIQKQVRGNQWSFALPLNAMKKDGYWKSLS